MLQSQRTELEIAKTKKEVELHKALTRLEKNPDFIKIITEAYQTESALKLVKQRGSVELRSKPTLLETNTRKIDAISELNGFFSAIHATGLHGIDKLPAFEDELAYLLNEEV